MAVSLGFIKLWSDNIIHKSYTFWKIIKVLFMDKSTTVFVNVSWTYKKNTYYPKVVSFICGIKLSNLRIVLPTIISFTLAYFFCLCDLSNSKRGEVCWRCSPKLQFGGFLFCFQDVLAFHFSSYVLWCQKFMFLLSGYWNKGYKYPSLLHVMLWALNSSLSDIHIANPASYYLHIPVLSLLVSSLLISLSLCYKYVPCTKHI